MINYNCVACLNSIGTRPFSSVRSSAPLEPPCAISKDRFHRFGGGVREFNGEDGRVAGCERGVRGSALNPWLMPPFVVELARKWSVKGLTSLLWGVVVLLR